MTSPDEERINDLLARCIEEMEMRGPSVVDELCASEPDVAEVVRGRLESLRAAGVLAPPEPPPTQIDRYRILESIGHGGMGTVFLAEQREPIRRRVAVKVIKLGMDTHQVLARFEAERQAMAMMSHPNIAKVLDAGATDRGRPYFVMDYVRGQHITEYCDRRELGTEQRLELLLPLCDAVQHAHSKGVIHRDLKPSNILVRDSDTGEPAATIIDFGVAKATNQRLTERTLFTETGRILGTPEYMSPEQAIGNDEAVDTRTDVYSLGVILYELLTGHLPFDPSDLRKAGYGDMHRILREREPPTPSTRISSGGERATAAAQARSTDAHALRRRLRGDLDWIVLKALEKDPGRRYATPLEFAADIRRHLAYKPVEAGPPTWRYRFAKYVRRNRALAATAASVLLALVVGLIASLLFWAEADAAKLRAEAASERARRDYDRACIAVDEMLAAVADNRLSRVPGMEPVRRQFLEKAVELYRGFLDEHGDDVDLLAQEANAHARLGDLYSRLGDTDAAAADLDDARRLWRALVDEQPRRHEWRFRLATVLQNAADVAGSTGDVDAARAGFDAALAELDAIPQSDRGVDWSSTLAGIYAELGVLHGEDRPVDAEAAFRKSIAIWRTQLEREPDEWTARAKLAVVLMNLGHALLYQSRQADAMPVVEEARSILEAMAAERPDDLVVQEKLAGAGTVIASVWYGSSQRRRAMAEYARLAPFWRKLANASPHLLEHRESLAGVLNNLGSCQMVFMQTDAARTSLRESIGLYDELLERSPDAWRFKRGLVRALANFARAGAIATPDGTPDPDSVAALQRAARLGDEIVEAAPDHGPSVTSACQVQMQLLRLHVAREEWESAELHGQRALEFCQQLRARGPGNLRFVTSTAAVLEDLARCREGVGDAPGAVEFLGQAIALLQPEAERDDARLYEQQRLPTVMRRHADLLAAAGDTDGLARAADALAARRDSSASDAYDAARRRALCAKLAGEDTPAAVLHADRSVELLRLAVARGFRDAARLRDDDGFAPIRDHPGLRDVLRRLDENR